MKRQYFTIVLFILTLNNISAQTTSTTALFDEFNRLYRARYYMNAIIPLRKAAEQGHLLAQFNLGTMYYKGLGVTQSTTEAVYWYRKAAEQGDAMAQFNLSLYIITQNQTEAFNWCRKAAEQGHAKAQNNLGFMYARGKGTLKDENLAFFWYQKSAEQGINVAQLAVAHYYFAGIGTMMDKSKAAFWTQTAYDNGNINAKEFWETNELWKYKN